VNKVISLGKNDIKTTDVGKLLERIRSGTGGKLAIGSMNEIIYVDTDSITRLESDSNYTNIFLQDGKKYNSTKTLKEYESLLDPALFYRVFKTHIINLKYVEKFIKGDGGYIIMSDGAQVPVSREKKQALLDILSSR
jgi:two-component system LytT family response regulator